MEQGGASRKRCRTESEGDDRADDRPDDQKMRKVEEFDIWGSYLPLVVMQKIFKLVINSDGVIPSLYKLAGVNRLWRSIAKEPSMITKLSKSAKFSVSIEEMVMEIIEDWNLAYVKEADLSDWGGLSDSTLQALADSCPLLSSVNLHGTCVYHVGFRYLVDRCPRLDAVGLSGQDDVELEKSIAYLIRLRGNTLQSISLAENSLKSLTQTLNLLTSQCSRLISLDLSSIQLPLRAGATALDVSLMQVCWPNLQVLRLGNTSFQLFLSCDEEDAPGFPHLVELSFGVERSFTGNKLYQVADIVLRACLKTSPDLKVLNLCRCTQLSEDSLVNLAARNLEKLFLRTSPMSSHAAITNFIIKWSRTLTHLDLSLNGSAAATLHKVMEELPPDVVRPSLLYLDLSGIVITCSDLKSVLDDFPLLVCLRLACCRGLPHSMVGEFDTLRLAQLRLDVAALNAAKDGA